MSSDPGLPIRVLALDFGMSRIGVAVSDELGMLAHPRPFVPAKPPPQALRLIQALVVRERITEIIVGLPLHMDGREGISARRARKFAADIGGKTGVIVHLVDERLTTRAAQGLLHDAGRTTKDSRSQIDSASAAFLLQGWLEARGSRM